MEEEGGRRVVGGGRGGLEWRREKWVEEEGGRRLVGGGRGREERKVGGGRGVLE